MESSKAYEWMNEEQGCCFEFLCDLFGGQHHVTGTINPCGVKGIILNTTSNRWATFDFDYLTKAVIMAHDRAIRFEIQNSNPGRLKILVHYRGCRDGMMYERHPTLEEAIQRHRRAK